MGRSAAKLFFVSMFTLLMCACFQSERPADWQPPQPPQKDRAEANPNLPDAGASILDLVESNIPDSLFPILSDALTEETAEYLLSDSQTKGDGENLSEIDVEITEGATSPWSTDSIIIIGPPPDITTEEVSAEDISEDCPKCEGADYPEWSLLDFQPASPGFGNYYGLEAFKGRVIVLALLAGW